MDLTLRVFLFVICVLFLAFVLLRIRRGQYLLKYSITWILLSVIGVISAIYPNWIYALAYALGFAAPSNFVYLVLLAFLLISNLIFCGILSRQETMIKSIVQEISLLGAVEESDPETENGKK